MAGKASGYISLSFDDGTLTNYEAAALLEKYQLKGTFYVLTQMPYRNDSRFFREAHVLDLHARGHEIGSHTHTHPNLVYGSPLNWRQLWQSRQHLLRMGVTAQSIAYPYGSHHILVRLCARLAGYTTGRGTQAGYNTLQRLHPYGLKCQNVVRTTTLGEVQGWIDHAIANRQWLILVFHEVEAEPPLYGCTPDMLEHICSCIRSRPDIRPDTVSGAFKAITGG